MLHHIKGLQTIDRFCLKEQVKLLRMSTKTVYPSVFRKWKRLSHMNGLSRWVFLAGEWTALPGVNCPVQAPVGNKIPNFTGCTVSSSQNSEQIWWPILIPFKQPNYFFFLTFSDFSQIWIRINGTNLIECSFSIPGKFQGKMRIIFIVFAFRMV